MYSRRQQQGGGAFIFLVGAGISAWNWHHALANGFYFRKAALLFPAFAVIGLGLMFFPGYREERLSRGEDVAKLAGIRLITPRWWGILAVALLAGGLNLYLMART